MDELRWILLGLGVVLIVAVYFWGRYKNQSSVTLHETPTETPSFSAMEDDDNDRWVDGVGPVRVLINDAADDSPGMFVADSETGADAADSTNQSVSDDSLVVSEPEPADADKSTPDKQIGRAHV